MGRDRPVIGESLRGLIVLGRSIKDTGFRRLVGEKAVFVVGSIFVTSHDLAVEVYPKGLSQD